MRRQFTTCCGKLCSSCNRFMGFENFYRSSGKTSGYKSNCKACVLEQRRAHYESPAGRKYAQEKAWRDHGIPDMTVERYEEMSAAQSGGCAICGVTVNENGTRLCVDHNHDTGAIRGLLCHNCNTTLGRFKDDSGLLRRAAEYLESHDLEEAVV